MITGYTQQTWLSLTIDPFVLFPSVSGGRISPGVIKLLPVGLAAAELETPQTPAGPAGNSLISSWSGNISWVWWRNRSVRRTVHDHSTRPERERAVFRYLSLIREAIRVRLRFWRQTGQTALSTLVSSDAVPRWTENPCCLTPLSGTGVVLCDLQRDYSGTVSIYSINPFHITLYLATRG